MNEVYNLERATALKELIDPTGRKWEIKGQRGSSLVHARPNPDREDAQIPNAFSGQWTSPSVLKEKIDVWLGRAWDKSELAALKLDRKAHAASVVTEEAVVKQTAEESLKALPEKIKAELGDIIATEIPLEDRPWPELQALAKELGVKPGKKVDLIAGIRAAEE